VTLFFPLLSEGDADNLQHSTRGNSQFTGTEALHALPTQVLAQSDLEAIHATSLRVLEKVGVEFKGEAALDVFRQNGGAAVEGGRVYLSPQTVEWAIDQAPGEFVLRARNPAHDLRLGQSQVLYTSAFGATFMCDAEKQTYRPATLDDLAEYVLLADRLENVHYVLTPFIPQDIPPGVAEIYAAAVQFKNTEKHIGIGVPTADYLDVVRDMGALVAEGANVDGPVYSLGATVNSPLVYTGEMLAKMIHAARHEIPLRVVSGALAGATAPVTLAGALAMQNAEILAGISLCQLVNPGCPVVYGTFVGGMDMRTGKWAAAGPEMSLINAGSAQLCRMYGIPLGYGTGGVTDCRVPDVRAGFEKGLTNLGAALCGVEVIHDGVSGLMAGGMAISFEQFIIDNEIARWINRFLGGIEVNQDTLAFEVIQEVGPGGQFLDTAHTVSRFRGEHLISPLLGREYPLKWPASGEEDIVFRARRRAQEILSTHRPPELKPEVKAGIQSILTRIGGERVLF
jgi:trimethylamine--corrinoid protein Co-methyltransferase